MYVPVGYYNAAVNQAAGVVTQLNFVADGLFIPQNNSPVFSEDYQIVAATAAGASLTAAQIDAPTIDAFNPFQVYPINNALKNAANPNVMDLRRMPIPVPLNEQITFKAAGGAGGAEPDLGVIWLRASGGGATDYPIPPASLANPRFMAIFTVTLVLTAGVWSAQAAVTFTSPLRGGIYQVNGLWLVCANGLIYQINFPRMPMYQGRKIYPGNLCDQIYGNQIMRFGGDWLGGDRKSVV